MGQRLDETAAIAGALSAAKEKDLAQTEKLRLLRHARDTVRAAPKALKELVGAL